ncbi:hypothetical protein L5G32_10155 [Gordonia sp. HY002]|uniref:hypothetical protein n=1 Tax=Gordonia zhenghanii TaxID=2911516 RepID=UPI001F180BFB|nr:hypothetical protein [Gordonia zhenghanii]MCF8570631.1 hypothetical protein [Gordonia zhenghanii]
MSTNDENADGTEPSDSAEAGGADQPDAPERQVEWEDPAAPLWNGLKYGVRGFGILLVVGLLVWWPYKGLPGLWGVLVGAGMGGAFVLITVVAILFTSKGSPSVVMGALMGSYLVKVVALIAVTALIKDMDFYNKAALVTMLLGAIVLVLGGELLGVMKTRQVYVDPEQTTDRKL